MFSFGFAKDDKTEHSNSQEAPSLKWIQSKEINPKERTSIPCTDIREVCCGNVKIRHMSVNENNEQIDSILSYGKSSSDLMPAVYEGGLKIWECTFDLLNFIKELDLKNKKVLDLGCGNGILGIYCSLKGATTVFQDYNIDVLQHVTIPNSRLNNLDLSKCTYFSGDWESFLEMQHNQEKFDIILTSETIYNTNNYKKIVNIFQHLLKKTGVIYLAAKNHYFGVGGGLCNFTEALDMEEVFQYSTCWECSTGVKRSILKITLK